MTNLSRTYRRHLMTLVCLGLSGCASWSGMGAKPILTDSPPKMPSQQFAPVVRGHHLGAASNRARPVTDPRSPAQAESLTAPAVTVPATSAPATSAPASSAPASSRPATSRPATSRPAAQTPATHPAPVVVRGQQPESDGRGLGDYDAGRRPLPVSSADARSSAPVYRDAQVSPAQYGSYYDQTAPGANSMVPPPEYPPAYGGAPGQNLPAAPPIGYATPGYPPGPEFQPGPTDMLGPQPYTGRLADLIVNVREQQTGRFMFGVGVNSDAGLTGQIVIDEYNFDWRRFPRSVDEIINGTAWRGAGQRLRIEAIPGSQLQRYLVNFTEPYLFDTNVSLNLSGFLYDRQYFDWDEQRVGGRIGLGYRLTPDLSLTTGLRLENIDVSDPRVRGVPELEEVLGDTNLYSGRVALTQDTRDSPFAATEGYYLEVGYEQVFGTFEYPRGNIDFRKYFLLNERPDGSGRHTLGTSLQVGLSGSDTPLYENFFAGGYSTLRGFRFRSAAPKSGDVYVGGEFSFLGSVEYMFPVTADDMLKGVVFCDYGTIEEKIQFEKDDFRVAFGAGLRIAIPAMGPAPIALDFAVPVAREESDRIQNFSFFVGFGR